ncbi:MAG: hypothetical protein AB8F34_13935 [Akkermansiaceae bacterium]
MSNIVLLLSFFSISGTLLACTVETPATTKSSTQDLVRHLLNQDLGIRKFSFPEVVHASSGKKVIPFENNKPADSEFLMALTKAVEAAIVAMNKDDSPVRSLRRINEASRHFEDHMRNSLQTHPTLTCSIPKNAQGKEQRSGYPDMLITHTDASGGKTHFYLDPKLYEKKSRSSSFRTFYYEPRTRTNKIQYDAAHLLIGISHDGNQGKWKFLSWEICDLSKFQVRLKAEFQASNRDLYRPHIIVKSSESP